MGLLCGSAIRDFSRAWRDAILFSVMPIPSAIRRLLRRHPLRFRTLAMLTVLLVVAGGMPRWVMHAVDAQHETLSAQSVAWDADEPHRDGDGDQADTHVCLHTHYFGSQPCTLPDALIVPALTSSDAPPLEAKAQHRDTLSIPPQRPPIA